MKTPKVSVGMPVCNGEPFLEETLESLLGQSYSDLEIVVSDNASRDRTPEILQKFAQRDHRVRFSRTDRLIPPAKNHERVFAMCRGEYFKFAAHDDLHAPTFIARCAGVLDTDPDTVLVYSRVEVIDGQGQHLHDYTYELATDAPNPARRFGALVRADHKIHGAYEIYGLMRAEALRSIPPQGNYPRADSVMLARLALLGKFHQLPEILFLSRQHVSRSVRQKPRRSRLEKYIGAGPTPPIEWWDPDYKGGVHFPEWKVAEEYLKSVAKAPITNLDRMRCLYQMASWLAKTGAPKLGRDLIIAGEQMLLGRPNPVRT